MSLLWPGCAGRPGVLICRVSAAPGSAVGGTAAAAGSADATALNRSMASPLTTSRVCGSSATPHTSGERSQIAPLITPETGPASMHAPKVVAKGQDLLAQRIREIAIAHGIPIIERKPLARALYRLVEVGKEIPEQFYSAVAEILAYVYELTGKLRKQRSA